MLGAGLAGCQIGTELARRGCQVELIDRLAGPALATSGNWAGCYLPAPSRDDNLASRLTRAGFLALQQRLPPAAAGLSRFELVCLWGAANGPG